MRGDSTTTFVTNVYADDDFDGGILTVVVGSDKEYVLEITGAEVVEGSDGRSRMVESDKYDTEWITLQRTPEKKSPYECPPVYMNLHREKKLQEVTVTASKVMFYHKGDTLVYNASAFVLAEGSTLDALLHQLPGVELRSNGVIYCDGRRVDNLLLNGKDLFNGKRELMLQNLAAYTVKDIAVYDKAGRRNELMGIDTGDKAHVMDVRLKRQYSNGWVLNAEAGYGTRDRYLGKLFGMWFSDNVSMTVFGGANNLSDGSNPGAKDGAWSRERMGSGVSERQTGGLTYLATGADDRWELKGSVDVLHLTERKDVQTTRENFLSPANTFDYYWSNATNKSLHLNTHHSVFTKLGSKANLTISPAFSYRNNDDIGNSVSATFREQIEDISRSRVREIYDIAPDLASLMLNRDMREWMSRGNNYNGRLNAQSDIKLPQNNLLTLNASGVYNQTEHDRFNRFELNEGQNATPVARQYQYFKNHPDHTLNIYGKATLTKYFNYHMIHLPVWYEFHHIDQKHTSELYMVDKLAGYTPGDYPIGTLPSMTQLSPLIDIGKSYMSKERRYDHTVGLAPGNSLLFDINKDYSFQASCNIILTASKRAFDYLQGTDNSHQSRTFWLPAANLYFDFRNTPRNNWNYSISADVSSSAPEMINLVDLPVTDPLVRVLGNADLAPSHYYYVNFRADRTDRRKRKHLISAGYSITQDALARGSYYNMVNGQQTFRTYNVNGNMSGNVSYEFFVPFGKNRQFNFTTKTQGWYNHSVDFVGSYMGSADFSTAPPRNIVNNFSASEKVTLNWMIGNHRLTAYADARVNRYNSSDTYVADFTSWTCNYGAVAVLNLPQSWGISTDFTLYTRRGFLDSRMNTTEAVWNARISKSIMKGSLTFVLDAYDLLHQLSNITYVINAQARTETVSNVIPSYLLFHIQYKLNINPKRR